MFLVPYPFPRWEATIWCRQHSYDSEGDYYLSCNIYRQGHQGHSVFAGRVSTTIHIHPNDLDEAHDNGLKMAIAYPNPGKDVLNIRTGSKDARVEVYDMSGRMVYGREITENVTSINTTSWPAGSYVWWVVVGTSTGSVTEAESGKWIKQ